MGLSRDQLIWKALVALYAVAEEARAAPVPKSFLLRFVLAFLFCATGARKERRWVVESFWRSVTRDADDELGRSWLHRDAISAINGILGDLGWETSPETYRALQDALEAPLPPEQRRPKIARHEGELPPWQGYAERKGRAPPP
jgi:hypothetical protein